MTKINLQVVMVNGDDTFPLTGGEGRKMFQLLTSGAGTTAFAKAHAELQPFAAVAEKYPDTELQAEKYQGEDAGSMQRTHLYTANIQTLADILAADPADRSMVELARAEVVPDAANPTRGRGSSGLSVNAVLAAFGK